MNPAEGFSVAVRSNLYLLALSEWTLPLHYSFFKKKRNWSALSPLVPIYPIPKNISGETRKTLYSQMGVESFDFPGTSVGSTHMHLRTEFDPTYE